METENDVVVDSLDIGENLDYDDLELNFDQLGDACSPFSQQNEKLGSFSIEAIKKINKNQKRKYGLGGATNLDQNGLFKNRTNKFEKIENFWRKISFQCKNDFDKSSFEKTSERLLRVNLVDF